ncbi:MAG: hypothetical protein Kow0056_14450 [Coriobacteriia bacterium]
MLERYFAILEGRALPRFLEARSAGVLEERAGAARGMLRSCTMCARECGANRASGHLGWCGVGARSRVASDFIHLGEELELTPSHTVFFSGCTMACAYCQNHDIAFHPDAGRLASPEDLARSIERRVAQGARNVNFVGGDPAPHLATVLETLSVLEVRQAVVWNSNMYLSESAMDLLCDVVDVFLADIRYGDDACALRLSDAPDYTARVRRAIERAHRESEVVLRHLVLPGHLECCTRPVLEWVAGSLSGVYLNLMFQYRPCHEARQHEGMGRRLTRSEIAQASAMAQEAGVRPA